MNEQAINPMRSIFWDGVEYGFRSSLEKKPHKDKAILRGHFENTAPPGLEPNTDYCIKIIDATPASKDLPQNRDYFDLIDFQGPHLRPILARNTAANACVSELRKFGTCSEAKECTVVEPLLESVQPIFKNPTNYSYSERLNLVFQAALGCEELTERVNRLGPYFIQAHRDVKADNILMAIVNGERRYYLIDFASVRLHKEVPAYAPPVDGITPSDTFNCAMSPGNTAPEDLGCAPENPDGTPFRVTGKTDVYALGMILCELFQHTRDHTGSSNPNARWARLNGWNPSDVQATIRDLKNGFMNALGMYEVTATWDNTWIEQDLASHSVFLQWEDMNDQNVIMAIRKLFFDATRIDPKKRINLPEFIERMKLIIDLEAHDASKIPISIYLFDQTDFNRNRRNYVQAAQKVLDCEKQLNGQASSALCVAFRKALPTDRTHQDALMLLDNAPVSNSRRFAAALQQCDTRNGMGSNYVLHALNFAAQKLLDLQSVTNSPYVFSGRIHLFTPENPVLEKISPLILNNQPTYLMDYLGFMNLKFKSTAHRFFVYSPVLPDVFCKDGQWYAHFQLDPPGEPDRGDFHHTAARSPYSNMPPQFTSEDKQLASFYDSTFDYYIELEDGSKGYIGMK